MRTSSFGCVLHLGHFQNLLSEVTAEVAVRSSVRCAAEDRRELNLHAREADEADGLAGLELHEHVDVAVRPEVRPQDRAE